ncbi:MAG: energy-coupling factor ABC transporter permease [Candidatus Omnitrophica bacterium]|nr:energy-coupling factor ABC transporter permease [Candidatus Omnitrophota bacterium]
MHIPNAMLQGQICPVTAVASVIGIGLAAWKAFSSKEKPAASRFAAITALIFAVQMMNFSISGGTSGHLLGGVLAAALLGIPFGILSIALVVTTQCLVFSDGGFIVLGANILNMAIIGAGLGGLIQAFLSKGLPIKSVRQAASLGLTSWLAVMMAALACSIELAVSGTIPFFKVVGAMLGTHAFIGIGEGLITVAAYYVFTSEPGRVSQRRSATVPLLAAGIIAFVLSPFASGFPDGLEWVAGKFQFLHESSPTFISPLSDYIVPAVSNEMLATGLAGLAGLMITFFIAWIVARLLVKPVKIGVSS